ncbi:hypothetical protein SERLA73DRAFT_133788 [Serpula lacrymans var. lacrymans S7.3]|uniref:SnoaL-like domain-containing protein n=2 Tax=Serpula lacrymans var. lacrymans TaxID=341189 RepID=F8PSK0_SERL3|nr:uncharacterized protein SERLADRAFT_463248 [Serpula lacrymans var. lacrymans S7.9]EGO00759.1 hypothetical protein SERLA73DRAFT_133788 [Serpula lacrymans var. lacrymans S7.3]EGO26323.1 hypothetical protein SERLADRAFT_463248 [Serpula lacrymans var. lacrymans S7.9]
MSSSSWQPSPNASPKVRVAVSYVDALSSWTHHDSPARRRDSFAALFAPNLEHRILPRCLSRPVLNKKQYIEYIEQLMPMFAEIQFTIHELLEIDDVVVFHGSSKGWSVTNSPYENEFMVILQFTTLEDDLNLPPQIVRAKEFVDSETCRAFFKAERERIKTASRSTAAGS